MVAASYGLRFVMENTKSFQLKRFVTRAFGYTRTLVIVAAASVFLAACGENALSKTPTNALEFQQRAWSESMKGKNAEAIADYSSAIKTRLRRIQVLV